MGGHTHDDGAAAYDRFTGRWSRLYVPCLVAAAEVASGHSVLDVAAGTGGATVALASRVGAAGRVLAVDLSLAMLRVAASKLAGLPVRVTVMDGQRLACRPRSFDAVVCQLGLMFYAEPLRGLEECWRVLRPGGHIALQVWSRADRVPFYGLLADALSRELPEQRDALYRPSALADADRLHALLTRAGFRDVSVTPERRSLVFESFADYWEAIEAGASRIGQFYLELPESRRRAVREEVQGRMTPFRSGGRLVLEAEALIGRGVRREAREDG
jgi:ubiquinone/menaquinone biosynthesis C-methylase UbiE